jgi:hypothetical protein
VGKGCHTNDEREGLIDPGARAQRMTNWRACGALDWFFFVLSYLAILSCCCSGPLFPRTLRRLLALLCCCSALGRHPSSSPRRCCGTRTLTEAHTRRRRQPSKTHLRMSGGKACGKQAAQYTGKQPDDGVLAISRDTTSTENEVHSSGHTHRKSMILKEVSAAKETRGKGKTEKGK